MSPFTCHRYDLKIKRVPRPDLDYDKDKYAFAIQWIDQVTLITFDLVTWQKDRYSLFKKKKKK